MATLIIALVVERALAERPPSKAAVPGFLYYFTYIALFVASFMCIDDASRGTAFGVVSGYVVNTTIIAVTVLLLFRIGRRMPAGHVD